MSNLSAQEDLEIDEQTTHEIQNGILELEKKSVVTEEDLNRLSRNIEEQNLTHEQLIQVMDLLGGILERRPEEWLRELGIGLLTAAHLRVARETNLDHSLPDNGTRTLIFKTITSEVDHSLVFERDTSVEKKEEEEHEETRQQSDLEQSWFFEGDEVLIDTTMSIQKILLEKLRSLPQIQVKITDLSEIQLHWNSEQYPDAHLFLEILERIKTAVDVFLEQVFEEANIRQRAKNKNYTVLFFRKNPLLIQNLLEIKKLFLNLEERTQELLELQSPDFQISEAMEFLQITTDPLDEVMPFLKVHALNVLREHYQKDHYPRFQTPETDMHPDEERAQKKLKRQINFLLEKTSKLQAILPDPWAE